MAIQSYNKQALTATSLIRQGIAQNVAQLKQQLPRVDVVFEVGISTRENAEIVHRLATLRLNYSPDKGEKLGLNISVHKYEELDPSLQTIQAKGNSQSLSILEQASDVRQLAALKSERSDDKITQTSPQWVKVVHDHYLTSEHKDQPNAQKVLRLICSIFPNGFPLPAQASVLQYHFTIMAHSHSQETIETLGSRVVNPIQIDSISSYSSFASEYGFCCSPQSPAADGRYYHPSAYASHLERFQRLVAVAEGRTLPLSIPSGAKITSATAQFQIVDGNEKKQIDDGV